MIILWLQTIFLSLVIVFSSTFKNRPNPQLWTIIILIMIYNLKIRSYLVMEVKNFAQIHVQYNVEW